MLYTSTRDSSIRVESSQAIAHGISKDGGLFVPVEIPKISMDDIIRLADCSYIERAKEILSLYLTDFTAEELDYCVNGAYAEGRFSDKKVAPLKKLDDNTYILELWKGPTGRVISWRIIEQNRSKHYRLCWSIIQSCFAQ